MHTFYLTGILLYCSVLMLPLNPFQTTEMGYGEFSLPGEHVQKHTDLQSVPVLIALKNQEDVTGKQKSGRSEKSTTETGKKKNTSPKQNKKKGTSKDFVPSEKIKADKAVDFPADI